MTDELPKIIMIVGPTASGKTDLGIFLAKKFGGEVVNADSRQIYRGMDIATGKPSFDRKKKTPLDSAHGRENRKQAFHFTSDRMQNEVSIQGIRHHLFNIAKPDQVITLAEWKRRALAAIRDILKRGKVPIVVGGTALYMKTLVENWEIPEVPPNPKLRLRLERKLKKEGIAALWKQLMKLDPDARTVVQRDNPRRVMRALEVCLATGKPFTSLRTKGEPLFEVLEIGLNPSRAELYRRIDARVDWQIKHGLIEETQRLLKKYPRTLPAMSGIGYGEIATILPLTDKGELRGLSPSLRGAKRRSNLSMSSSGLTRGSRLDSRFRGNDTQLAEATQKIKHHTHDYARHQLTWFRRDARIRWVKTKQQAVKVVKHFLKKS